MGHALNNAIFAHKPKTPPPPKKDNHVKDAICLQCGEVRHWRRNYPVYLAELMKKKKLSQGASISGIFTIELYSFPSKFWIYDTGCSTHIRITTQGLQGSKKLKPGALSLYVGDGYRATIEAIGTYHLELPSGLVIVLNNCHYAPFITRGVISVSRLFDDGFINRFDDNNVILVTKNNLVYSMAVPRDGIFEIDMSYSNTNDSSMYAITNKRAKINLDSSLLWRCRLGHISKKGIEKLQHDGLFNSIDIESLGNRYGYVYLLKHKHEVFETFKVFQKEVENQLGKTIKSLCSDCGCEYMSQEFLDHLKEHGIIAHRTPPYTPQNNRVSERRNRTLLDMGYDAFVKRDTLTKPDKLDPRSFKCIFIGYPKETMGYSFYSPSENKVFVARNAEFFESKLLDLKASGSVEDLKLIQEEDTNPFVDTSLNHEEDDQEIDEPQSDINPIRKSFRTRCGPDCMCLYIDAEGHELGDLVDDVWVLVELPPNARTVGSKWLFKKKTDMDDIRAIRILIAIAAYYDYEIWQMDVKTAFVNGHLFEKVYMEQPEGFANPKYPNHGKLHIFLGSRSTVIGQSEKLKLSKSQGASTPAEKQRMQNIPYASAVGSIMYAARCTRPDVVFAQNMTNRFQQNPGEEHWSAVKNILKYLRNTKDMFLVYGGNMKRELRVSCYTDAGYLTDADNLKS
nr:hypothetical protein [Tanacetum cinerariifolium]